MPCVFLAVGAPVDIGLLQSLSHPDGNMTGTTFEAATETYAKRLQILTEILPNLQRVRCSSNHRRPERDVRDAVC
jgi:putative ABC transport system substrate-binding protein